MKIADLRAEMGLSLEAFAALIGQQSRGRMSIIERENRCALASALKIEELSSGRIDAADLSEDVRKARHGLELTASSELSATGQSDEMSGGVTA